MEQSENYIIVNCTNCGNKMQIKPNTASLFCVKCRTWMQLKGDRKREEEKT